MYTLITPHTFSQTVRVPASKSHTIRRLLIAAFARGVSTIDNPLDSLDTRSCRSACQALGAEISSPAPRQWQVRGTDGAVAEPASPIDVGNSGTTLFLALAMASLGQSPVVFTGDDQIKRRSAAPLLQALSQLGVATLSAKNDGCVPITVRGPWRSGGKGKCRIECPTSQYLSALLLAAPLAGSDTEIEVPLLNEKPYVALTLSYLDKQGVRYERAEDFSSFHISGAARYMPVNGAVPADFSSAAFPAAAIVISGGQGTLTGLDPDDQQGDKVFFEFLKQMGAAVEWEGDEWVLKLSREAPLRAATFDLNATPDLLPLMSVLAAYAEGETRLVNVAHARIKETDRIAVMARELGKLGVRATERPDGLVIQGGAVQGGSVDGHGDHRVVMALAVAGLGASAPVRISGAESADVSYPGFLKLLGAPFTDEA
jgi:3-phosphoshikimate 1-carboxyvinyltransferase